MITQKERVVRLLLIVSVIHLVMAVIGFHNDGPKPTVYMFTMANCGPCEQFVDDEKQGKTWLNLLASQVMQHDGKPYRKVEYIRTPRGGVWALDGDVDKAAEGSEIYAAFREVTGYDKQLVVPTFWAGEPKFLVGYSK